MYLWSTSRSRKEKKCEDNSRNPRDGKLWAPREEGSDLIDIVAASIFGRTDGSSLSRKSVCKEYAFQIISMTTRVAISRRENRYRLVLRDHQGARGGKKAEGCGQWPADGTLMRIRIDYIGSINSENEYMWVKEIGKWLAEEHHRKVATALWKDIRYISGRHLLLLILLSGILKK